MLRSTCLVLLWCVPMLLPGQEAQLERSVRSVYGHLLIARAAQQRYTEKDSASAAANDSAIVGWLRSAGVPALERVARARYPAAVAGAEADVRRLQGMVNLTVRMAGSRYSTLGEFLENALPWGKYEQDLARLRPAMGVAVASTEATPGSVRGATVVSKPPATSAPVTSPPAVANSAQPSQPRGDVEGVYLRRVTRTGYGGMVVFAYRPFVHYADGSVFLDPTTAADVFDRSTSRAAVPHEWGQVTGRAGDTWRVRMVSVQRTRDALDRELVGVSRLVPARAGRGLSGEYRSLGGTGSIATGGSAAVIVEDTWSFLPDGRFARGGFAGSSNGSVTTGTTKPTKAGRYRVEGYAIELTYEDGTVERLVFGMDEAGGLVSVGGGVYTTKRR